MVVFVVNLIINFFLSPYIVKELGVEANGYVTLAYNFVSYASLATIALNSMAGRFITVNVYQDDMQAANKYYTAVTLGNFLLSLMLLIPGFFCVFYLENFINIPSRLVWDVKILFSLVFINYLISVAFSSWNTATFVTNKLYIHSLYTMQAQLLRIFITFSLFSLFQPSVYFLGISTLTATFWNTMSSRYYKNKLMPTIRMKFSNFNFSYLLELVSSGIWNTISQVGNLLLSGLDLLLANLFVGAEEMGMLSLAKTLPIVITQLSNTLRSIFTPTLTIKYAKGDIEGVKSELKKGMKLTGTILTIPLVLLIVFGNEFYSLWLPGQNAQVLQIASILTCMGMIFTSGTQVLYNIFTVVNRINVDSILIVISGGLSVIVTYLLLKTTDLGIYAIAGTSSVFMLLRNMAYTVPFAAKYLDLKWYTFFPEVGLSVISVFLLALIGYGIQSIFEVNSWITLFLAASLTGIIGICINIFILLNRIERDYLFSLVKNKVHLKK